MSHKRTGTIPPSLLAELESDVSEERARAVARVTAYGSESTIDLLVAVLAHDRSERVRCHAASALGMIGTSRCAEALAIGMLGNANDPARAACSRALAWMEDPPTMAASLAALSDPAPGVVLPAIVRLGRYGYEPAIGPIKNLLRTGEWRIRLCAAKALADLRAVDEEVLALTHSVAEDARAREHDEAIEEADRTIARLLGGHVDPGMLGSDITVKVVLQMVETAYRKSADY